MTCFGAGCHDPSRDLPTVHSLYAGPGSENPEFASACELCHDNPAVDVTAAADMRCTGVCHSGATHTGYTAGHALTAASDECVTCHPSDISTAHGASTPGPACATCHANRWNWSKTGDCLGCHNGTDVGSHSYSPVDPQHYSAQLHTPSDPATFTAAYQGPGADGPVVSYGVECRACHSESLKSAHSSTSVSGGSVTCVECHTDTTLGSSVVVSDGWPTGRCTDCHDAGAAMTHDSVTTSHTVVAGTCAGTGSTCHNYVDLAELHTKSQSGGVPKYNSCGNADPTDPTACHNVLDVRPTPFILAASCGQGTTGCHQEKTASNHGYDVAKHAATLGSARIKMGASADDVDHGYIWSADVECAWCHYSDLGTQHSNDCAGCHSGANPVASLGGAWGGSCQQGNCHPGALHPDMQPDHNGAYYNSSQSCDSCHTSTEYYLGETDCSGCHVPADTVTDQVAPTTTSNALASYTGTATISLTASDNVGGRGVDRTYYILDGAAATLGSVVTVPPPATGSASHTLQYYSVDRAGNAEAPTPVPALSFDVVAPPDTTPPSGTMSVNGGASYTKLAAATVNSAVSDSGSGIYQMRIDPGTGTYGAWIAYSATSAITLPPGDGVKTVSAQYIDNASNFVTLTDTIVLDTAPPATTSDAVASYIGPATITLSATDVGGSGVAATRYRVDSGAEQTGTVVTVGPPATGSASHTVYFWSIDNATNTEVVKSASFDVTAIADSTPPVTLSSFNPAAGAVYRSAQPVDLSATDTGGSGVKATYYQIDGGSVNTGTSFTISGDGLHRFTYYSTDNADNVEGAHTSNEFRIDTIAPVTAANIVSGNTYSGTQLFALSPADGGSGVGQTWWSLDSATGPWTSGTAVPVIAPVSGTQSHTLYFYSVDVAGNPELQKSVPFYVEAAVGPSNQTFNFTGGPVTWTVPAGVTAITVDLDGAKGADSTIDGTGGGLGGQVRAVIPVTPGDVLTLKVGGQGADTTGGWGGGSGGSSSTFGAGGGSTSIAHGATILAEAGGGGGGGEVDDGGAGGAQGSAPGGNQGGASGGNHGGGGGGWNGGTYDTGTNGAGYGGTSFVNVGQGVLTQGVVTGDGSATITWTVPSTATLAFVWPGSGQADLHVEDASGTTIASTFLNPVEPWYVTVQAGRRYYLVVDAGFDNGANIDFAPPAYGIWSDDPAINPDGILSPGETVTWYY